MASPPRQAAVERARAVRRVLWIVLGLNLLVCAAKGIYGLWAGSLALAADALHSLLDASSNVVGLVLLHYAEAPPDEGHPYGHRKLEILGATGIGVAVGIAAVRFAWGAVEALIDGSPQPKALSLGLAVGVATLIINTFVAIYEGRQARRLDSPYLSADAAHTGSDVFVTLAVIASLTAASFGVPWADPLGALVVTLMIGWIAWRVLSRNLSILVDAAVIDPKTVETIAASVPGVTACHRVRSRGTRGSASLDLHLLMAGDLPLRSAHAIAHEVEDRIRAQLAEVVDVTVHMEPDDDDFEGL